MDHLHPTVRPIVLLSDTERIACIYASRWIGYPRANEVLAQMEKLFTRPRIGRMPGMLLVSETNNGKSRLLERFAALHPKVDDPSKDRLELPVLMVQCPPGPDERRLYHAILDELGVPYTYSSRIEQKHRQAKAVMEKIGTRLLVLDEFHNVLAGPVNRTRYFLNAVKVLSNDLRLPIIAAGTPEAQNAVTIVPELANRLPPIELPLWRDRDEFVTLLNSFEKLLPLKEKSNLRAESTADELLALSEGILGEVATVLTDAACVAVTSGQEKITLRIIRGLKFTPPSRRRHITGIVSDGSHPKSDLFDAEQLSDAAAGVHNG